MTGAPGDDSQIESLTGHSMDVRNQAKDHHRRELRSESEAR